MKKYIKSTDSSEEYIRNRLNRNAKTPITDISESDFAENFHPYILDGEAISDSQVRMEIGDKNTSFNTEVLFRIDDVGNITMQWNDFGFPDLTTEPESTIRKFREIESVKNQILELGRQNIQSYLKVESGRYTSGKYVKSTNYVNLDESLDELIEEFDPFIRYTDDEIDTDTGEVLYTSALIADRNSDFQEWVDINLEGFGVDSWDWNRFVFDNMNSIDRNSLKIMRDPSVVEKVDYLISSEFN